MDSMLDSYPAVELSKCLDEARAGSGDSMRLLLDLCRQYLIAIASESRPSGPAEVRRVADVALGEVERLLPSFVGQSDAELRAWLRQIVLEQTRAFPAEAGVAIDRGSENKPDTGGSGTADASAPPAHEVDLGQEVAAELARSTSVGRTYDGLAASEVRLEPPLPELADFEQISKIGHGGMGLVYRAWQKKLLRWVALKCLPLDFAADPERLRRFHLEAQLAGRLAEHGILQVYDVVESGGAPILVLPFIEGGDLSRLIAARRTALKSRADSTARPSANDRSFAATILPFFDKILDALVHLHNAGVLHRDIKPSNILLDKNGNGWLADFGLARPRQFDRSAEPRQGLGTPGFMSPEQWSAAEDIDARTDVFAMGVTIYLTLTTVLPYGKERLTADTPPENCTKLKERFLPPNLDLVLAKAIHPDRGSRYQSAADLRDDWQRVRKGLLPDKIDVGLWRKVRHVARQRFSQALAAGALALAAALTVMLLTPPAKIVRTVHVKTEPPGARVALIPLGRDDGEPAFEQALQSRGTTPMTVRNVPPGNYLVIAEVPGHGFHEVYRRVPEPGEQRPSLANKSFPHALFEERADKSVDLWEITVPRTAVAEGMALFQGGDFTMGCADFGPNFTPPHLRTVLPFYLDATEVTVARYRAACKEIPSVLQKLAPADQEAVRFVTFDQAVACAEKMGKRLPDEAEYEFAATNGGRDRFPWGNNVERITTWPIGPVGVPPYDRASANPTVSGLFSNVVEWTSSWNVPYPGAAWPADLVALCRETRIVRGGPDFVNLGNPLPKGGSKQYWHACFRHGVTPDRAHPGLGFRCARSAKPRFSSER